MPRKGWGGGRGNQNSGIRWSPLPFSVLYSFIEHEPIKKNKNPEIDGVARVESKVFPIGLCVWIPDS